MACRAVRARARAVRFRNETQLRDRERTAVWGFLCEHRANPTALNAVRSAPVRRAHVCGVVTGACFPRPAPVSGAGSARYDGGFASCRSAHSTPGSQARGSPAYLCGFRPKLNRPFVIAVRTSAHDVRGGCVPPLLGARWSVRIRTNSRGSARRGGSGLRGSAYT